MNCFGVAVLLALLVEVAANEKTPTKIVHHQICCSTIDNFRLRISDISPSKSVVKFWEQLLNVLLIKNDSCIHNFGVASNDDGDLFPTEDKADDWRSEHIVGHTPPVGEALCSSIIFHVPATSEPLKTPVDFFTPGLLEEITRRRPLIRIEFGTGDFDLQDGRLQIKRYSPQKAKTYDYDLAYGEWPRRFATREQLSNIVQRDGCKVSAYQPVCTFIEAVTGNRIANDFELKKLLTNEEIKTFLTFDKLKNIKVAKLVKKLEKFTLKKVPIDDLLDLRFGMFDRTLSFVGMGPTMMHVGSRSREGFPKFVNLEGIEKKFQNFVAEAQHKEKYYSAPMQSALQSTQIADTFPQWMQRRRTSHNGSRTKVRKSKSRKGGELSPRQITDFLLVNSLLAVTNTKYSDIIASAAMHKLQRAKLPIFSVCAENITWEPRQPPTWSSSGDWLSSNYRFTMTGSRHSSFGYQTLDELKNHTDLSDSSQCAILALVGVPKEGFKDLTRQPFDMIFGIFTRDQTSDIWRLKPQEQKGERRPPVSADLAVDPWKLIPEKYSSNQTLGQLLDQVAERIEENGSPEWPEDTARRPSSKRSRIGQKAQFEQAMVMSMNQPKTLWYMA